MRSNRTKLWLAGALLLVGAVAVGIVVQGSGGATADRPAPGPFSLEAPATSALDAPVDIEIESSGNGTARVTLRFHRPATGVTVLAYGTEGARVRGEGQPLRGVAVEAGGERTFESAVAPNGEGGGLFAVHVTGLFDGTLQMARTASVRLGPEPVPPEGRPAHASAPGERIVVDSEGTRVHVMPVDR